jgi:hypothetical protein
VAARLATVKHPAFAEEREWRLLTVFHDRYGEGHGLHSDPEASFRPSPMAIVPYIEVPLTLGSIVSIRVGPGGSAGVREKGVRRFLRALRSNASVLQADVPLRS